MGKLLPLLACIAMSSFLTGCDTRRRIDIKDRRHPFANTLNEAIAICKEEAATKLSDDLVGLQKYGYAFFHTDKEAIREVISIPCDTNHVAENLVSRERGLDLGEICYVSDNARMRVQKLIPDEESAGDPNWNKPIIKGTILSIVNYPCKNGNGCEEAFYRNPLRREMRDPSKCNLPASSLKP